MVVVSCLASGSTGNTCGKGAAIARSTGSAPSNTTMPAPAQTQR